MDLFSEVTPVEEEKVAFSNRLPPIIEDINSIVNHSETELKSKTSEDDYESDQEAPIDLNKPIEKVNRRVLYHLWKGNYERAIQYAEVIYQRAENIEEGNNIFKSDGKVYSSLLYSKCLLLSERNNKQIIEKLISTTSEMVLQYNEIDYRLVLDETKKSSNKQQNVSQPLKKSVSIIAQYKELLNMIGLIAAIYKSIGNPMGSEKMYWRYCKIVEETYGPDSIEVSNCLYYIGIFYYEEEQYEKALLCTERALLNRSRKLGSNHISCGDCHFNIGLICKCLCLQTDAKSAFDHSLNIRREGIGMNSLHVASVLEELGKLYLENDDFTGALLYLKECYDIRKKLIKNHKHIEITRISLLLIYTSRKIEKNLKEFPAMAELVLSSKKIFKECKKLLNENFAEKQGLSTNESLQSSKLSSDISLQSNFYNQKFLDRKIQRLCDIDIFILSLDSTQLLLLNATQKYAEATEPLLFDFAFTKLLSEYQNDLLKKSDIAHTPRRVFLIEPSKFVEVKNLIISEEFKRDKGMDEDKIIELLKTKPEFYKTLNRSQLEILKKINQHKSLTLNIFLHSLKEIQNNLLGTILKEEFKKLDVGITKNIQHELLLFVENSLTETMFSQIVLEMTQEFYSSLDYAQILQIASLHSAQRKIKEHARKKEPIEWIRFVDLLAEFIKSFSNRQSYLFGIGNSFMLNKHLIK